MTTVVLKKESSFKCTEGVGSEDGNQTLWVSHSRTLLECEPQSTRTTTGTRYGIWGLEVKVKPETKMNYKILGTPVVLRLCDHSVFGSLWLVLQWYPYFVKRI